jgi:hypothetical protein
VRLTEHIAYIVELRNAYVILVRKPEGQRLPCPCAGRRIILTWILRIWDIEVQVDSLGSGKDRVFESHKKHDFFFMRANPLYYNMYWYLLLPSKTQHIISTIR